ncbi:MAG TPA: DUF4286 family protein [Chthoniobacterales bacterium]
MVIYSVEIFIAAAIEAEWLAWMQSVHVPDVIGTGCFSECHIYRIVEPPAGERGYVLRYDCSSLAEYERYRANFAAALQEEHAARFGGRFRGSRQVFEEVGSASRH